jgi:enamine deaminase RidA (YjgF/YER057c/UK114 family)
VIYDTDIEKHVEGMRKVRDRFFKSHFPSGTKVEVKRLAHPDYLLEISAIAVID